MNWLSAAVAVFLILMIWVGARKGLIKMVMSFAAMLLTLLIAAFIYEPLEKEIRIRTGIYESIENGIGSYVARGAETAADGIAQNAEALIDNLMLPEVLKDYLRQGNTPEHYRELGVSDAAEYVTQWLAGLVFSALVYVCAFVAVRLGLWILMILLDSIVQLPVLRQLNSLAGGAVGFAIAVGLLWIGGLIVTAGAATSWGQEALCMIRESALLSLIYNNNFLISGILSK